MSLYVFFGGAYQIWVWSHELTSKRPPSDHKWPLVSWMNKSFTKSPLEHVISLLMRVLFGYWLGSYQICVWSHQITLNELQMTSVTLMVISMSFCGFKLKSTQQPPKKHKETYYIPQSEIYFKKVMFLDHCRLLEVIWRLVEVIWWPGHLTYIKFIEIPAL